MCIFLFQEENKLSIENNNGFPEGIDWDEVRGI